MKKIFILLMLSSLVFASWQMEADAKGGVFMYNTNDGRILYCKSNQKIQINGETYEHPPHLCRKVFYAENRGSKKEDITTFIADDIDEIYTNKK